MSVPASSEWKRLYEQISVEALMETMDISFIEAISMRIGRLREKWGYRAWDQIEILRDMATEA